MDGDSDDVGVPVTPRLLADLQAGLLDDDTAARLRRRAREDPAVARTVAALDRVRRDLAELQDDAASAPAVPPDVNAQIGAALRAASSNRVVEPVDAAPSHAARGTPHRRRVTVTAIGGLAALVAIGVGTVMLFRSPAPATPASPTAESITVSTSPGAIPLSDQEILGLLTAPADLGGLSDPQRRASCLNGLGYPSSTAIVGARPLAVNGRPGVLLLLASAPARIVTALVVAPNCSSVDTGLLAEKTVTRP